MQFYNFLNMKKSIILLIFLSTFGYTQQTLDEHLQFPRGKFFLKAEFDYRLLPLTDFDYLFPQPYHIGIANYDKQNSGFSVNYSLNYYLLNCLSIGFTHSFRHTHLNFNDNLDTNQLTRPSNYRLFMDYHFHIEYHHYFKNRSSIYVKIGYSLMNHNSDYNVMQTITDSYTGDVYKVLSEFDYQFDANQFAIGYRNRKFDLSGGVFQSASSLNYYNGSATIYIPYLKLGYNLLKF
jgi:hypothetical protein